MNYRKLWPFGLIDLFLLAFLVWGNRQINHLHRLGDTDPVLAVTASLDNTPVPLYSTVAPQKPAVDLPAISKESIFNDLDEAAVYPPEKIRTLIAAGDVMLGRAVNARSVKDKKFQWPFEKTAEGLAQADLTIVNLESPFLSPCPVTTAGMKFCADPAHVDGLELAGIDVVNLANNHYRDHGQAGIDATLEILRQNGYAVSGWDQAALLNVRGLSFAFLGFCPACGGVESLTGAGRERLALEIEAARKSADVVIVSFHWGVEYQAEPSSEQRELGREAIDLGADLVLGHHPHWVQPVEIYQGKLIVYSLGNFIFDQMWSAETKVGLAGRFSFYNDQLVDVRFLPVKIAALGQPEWWEDEESRRLLTTLRAASVGE